MANEDHGHVALPKLYGAPAYARPPLLPVNPLDRPIDRDELPLEAVQTEEERVLASRLADRTADGRSGSDAEDGSRKGFSLLRGRPFRLGSIAGRRRGNGNGSGS